MWIGIGIAVWVVMYLVNLKMLYNVDEEIDGFGIVFSLFGPLIAIMLLQEAGMDCFRRKDKKMEKTYWDEKAGQIMTKDGKCVYDVNNIADINGRGAENKNKIGCIYEENKRMFGQLACSAKTQGKHKMVWNGAGATREQESRYSVLISVGYIFKCSVCGLEITKTEKELTPDQREGLKKLKLI